MRATSEGHCGGQIKYACNVLSEVTVPRQSPGNGSIVGLTLGTTQAQLLLCLSASRHTLQSQLAPESKLPRPLDFDTAGPASGLLLAWQEPDRAGLRP